MYVARSFWSFGACFIDICMILLLIFLVLGFLDQKIHEIISEGAGWVLGALALIYAVLAYKHKVPSLGNWALALRKYPRGAVEGYAGKGTLFLIEDLTMSARIRRLAVAIIILVSLFITLFVIN